ncbi:MAG: hypothetical protein HFI34_04215 [Lachnospiraceae bacterium]|nr:hypothetical protein [Lachnospiraceae bacterium]
MNNIRKTAGLLLMVMAAALLAAGCSRKDKEASEPDTKRNATLTVDEQEAIVITYTESFDKSYYDKEELESRTAEELAEFNKTASGDGSAVMESLNVKDGTAVMKIKFADEKVYVDYVKKYVKPDKEAKLFVGTYKDAVSAGYKFSGKFTCGEDLSTVEAKDFKETDGLTVVYTNEEQKILVPGDIIYFSENVSLEKGLAVTSEGKENYIIYKSDEK